MLISESKPVIQAQIGATINAFLSGDRSEIKTNWKGFRELAKLEERAEGKDEIVKQLAIYAVVERHDEDQQVLESLLVLQLLDLKPSIPIRALAPYLDSENQQLREFSQSWFRSHDICEIGVSSKSVNYRDYFKYVCHKRNKNQEVPTGFIEYIYKRSPDRALLVFLRVDRQRDSIARIMEMNKQSEAAQREREKNGDRKAELLEMNKMFEAFHRGLRKNGKETLPIEPLPPPVVGKIVVGKIPDDIPPLRDEMHRQRDEKRYKEILLAEHLVSNVIWLKKKKFDERFQQALLEAKEELSKLAKYDQWWARLYVAEIMRRNRELRLVDVLEKLSRDSNALVSKSAKLVLGQ